MDKTKVLVWRLVLGNEELTIDLQKLKNATQKSFSNSKESNSYKQKLVYDLLESAKNKDQNRFFYLLLGAINKPKKNFKELCKKLENYYDILPEEAFINFAYSIIIGIMSTYKNNGGE